MESPKTQFQIDVIFSIKKLRNESNVSQSQLSDLLSISNGQIGNIESPKFPHKYTLRQIYVMCKFFNYPIEKIFFNESELNLSKEQTIEVLILKLIEYDK